MNTNSPIYSISAVATTLGVPVATLRTWEDRYGLVVPERTPSRHRLFSRRQVEQLEFVKAQMDEGLSAADAHRLLKERIDGGEDVSPSSSPTSRPRLILLAENDPYAAEFEEHFLRGEGYEVEVTRAMEDARRTVDDAPPALVVLELLISGGRGLELCRTIKQRINPPAVLAVSTLESQDSALAAGADAFLPKPLDPARFTSTVKRLLGRDRPLAGGSAAV
ncbi:MAG TPA: MerR family transcriptional regulator [Actinomycetota bacterium]|jgi:DNA-binding transcriptional MerR regulator|nr:MerR family transcriptional regulator [Actinomycetota bacterium]